MRFAVLFLLFSKKQLKLAAAVVTAIVKIKSSVQFLERGDQFKCIVFMKI